MEIFVNIKVIMKSILALILIISLYSCDEKVYFDIPQNEKPLLKNNDTIFFYNNINHAIDTFIISLTDDYEVSDKRYYHEIITISYQKLNNPFLFNRFFIQQGVESLSISVDGNYFPRIYENDNTVNLNLNGIDYQFVYVKSDNNFPDTIPETIYYTYKHGIIRYNFPDNSYFEIMSN